MITLHTDQATGKRVLCCTDGDAGELQSLLCQARPHGQAKGARFIVRVYGVASAIIEPLHEPIEGSMP